MDFIKFQHTAARRRLGTSILQIISRIRFQHTAARRRLGDYAHLYLIGMDVSTHSRPKAAGTGTPATTLIRMSFNTQPPEGGWPTPVGNLRPTDCGFNTQPPEGGWKANTGSSSEASGFNTQPPEGGWASSALISAFAKLFQHTAARRRLANQLCQASLIQTFQHTAARRRLDHNRATINAFGAVSTHSRPKAAGFLLITNG